MRVLVVEDDRALRTTITRILQQVGYEVDGDGNGEVSLQLPIETQPNALVTDVNLGARMNGFELSAVVRGRWPSIGVVYLSGDPNSFGNTPLTPNDRILPKPFRLGASLLAVGQVSAPSESDA